MTDLQFAILRQIAHLPYDASVITRAGFPAYIVAHESLIRGGYVTVRRVGGYPASVLTATGRAALRVEVAA